MKTTHLRATLLAASSLSVLLQGIDIRPASAQDATAPAAVLPEVNVYGDAPIPNRVLLTPAEDHMFPATDAADYLRSVPGITIGRMGGHGIEPYIRGQSQGRLNIIDDGAFIHGGCPNRMDPPTSYMTVDSIDTLIVDKGYASVSNGPGGSGGTVRAKKSTPVFEDGKPYSGSVSAGLISNAYTRETSGNFAAGGKWGYFRGQAGYADAGNYKDGAGSSVRSAYSSHGGRAEVGLTPSANDTIRFGVQVDRIEDALFAGAGMDSPLSETFVLRTSYAHEFDPGQTFTRFDISAYGGMVDHVMDNYTLRQRSGNVMKVNSDSDTAGGKLSLDGKVGNTAFTMGGDLQVNNRDAVRFMGPKDVVNNNARIQAYSWPDITLSQVGLFGEVTQPLSETQQLRAGLRYDRVDVSADKADRVALMPAQSANDLYRQYYGVAADDRDENNFGGLLRYEMSLGKNYKMFAGLSRSVRTADATERGLAQNNNTASLRWVGRPDIAPEKHHQADIGGSADFDNWSLGGSVYYDRVNDFILRDLARGQDGVLLSDSATIYRNVDATLAGIELSGSYRFSKQWSMAAQTAFTYGENEEDNRPLAQIPPLEFTTSVEYAAPEWMAGMRMRSAFRQTRADIDANANSGQDSGDTGGYAVFDLYGEILRFEPMTISVGMTNMFDTVYANHVSRSNSFDPEVVQVNEPGRAFFLRASATF